MWFIFWLHLVHHASDLKKKYFAFWDLNHALFGRRGAKSRRGLSTTKEKVKAWLELWLLALHFFSHLRPDWAIQRVLFTSQVLKRWTGGEKVKGGKVSPTYKVSFRRERACSKHKKDRKVQINSMPLTNKGESNTASTLCWNLYPSSGKYYQDQVALRKTQHGQHFLPLLQRHELMILVPVSIHVTFSLYTSTSAWLLYF